MGGNRRPKRSRDQSASKPPSGRPAPRRRGAGAKSSGRSSSSSDEEVSSPAPDDSPSEHSSAVPTPSESKNSRGVASMCAVDKNSVMMPSPPPKKRRPVQQPSPDEQSATAALLHLPNSPVPKHSKSLFPSSDKENASQLRNTTALSAPSLPSVVSKTVPSMASLTSPAPTASRCTSHNGVGAMTPSQLDLITFSPMNFVKNLGIENVAGTSVNGGVNGNYGHPGNSANGDNSNNPMMPPPPVVGEGYLKQRSRTMSTSHANVVECSPFSRFIGNLSPIVNGMTVASGSNSLNSSPVQPFDALRHLNDVDSMSNGSVCVGESPRRGKLYPPEVCSPALHAMRSEGGMTNSVANGRRPHKKRLKVQRNEESGNNTPSVLPNPSMPGAPSLRSRLGASSPHWISVQLGGLGTDLSETRQNLRNINDGLKNSYMKGNTVKEGDINAAAAAAAVAANGADRGGGGDLGESGGFGYEDSMMRFGPGVEGTTGDDNHLDPNYSPSSELIGSRKSTRKSAGRSHNSDVFVDTTNIIISNNNNIADDIENSGVGVVRNTRTRRAAYPSTPSYTAPMQPPIPSFSSSHHLLSSSEGGSESPPPAQKFNPCNCKKSKCLKLYCECFAAEKYCDSCNCQDCYNNAQNEQARNDAIKATKAKNPNAFKIKIERQGGGRSGCGAEGREHNMGCRCKKSACLKKYCECFEAGVTCGDKCKCLDCLNYIGSQALIDRRRKIKDHKGAEKALAAAESINWNVPQHVQNRQHGVEITTNSRYTKRTNSRQSSRYSDTSSRYAAMSTYAHPNVYASSYETLPNQVDLALEDSRQVQVGMELAGLSGQVDEGMELAATGCGAIDVGLVRCRDGVVEGEGEGEENNGSNIDLAMVDEISSSEAVEATENTKKKSPTRTSMTSGSGIESIQKGSQRKKQSLKSDAAVVSAIFGAGNAQQTKATTLKILSFLSNDDLYNACLVSKEWSDRALDEQLWTY